MKKYILISIFFAIVSCSKPIPDNIEQVLYSGSQIATFDQYLYNQNGNLITHDHWDSLYQDKIDIEINLTKSMMQFHTTPSYHLCAPSEYTYSSPILNQYYTINIGYRVRYEFRIINDSLFADYYNLTGLGNDTLYINKKLSFKGERQY